MISAIFALAVAQVAPPREVSVTRLTDNYGAPSRLAMTSDKTPLDPAKVSPRHSWLFDWMIAGYGNVPGTGDGQQNLRFRVYSQDRDEKNDLTPRVACMLLRLWDYNVRTLRIDHPQNVNLGIVDVYLCYGGKAGGEQLFDEEDVPGKKAIKVNTIYIYDLPSLTDPVEMAREVAHEYGHAVLPPVGGYSEPESWANGYLGEKLYMRWMRDEMAAGHYGYLDSMLAPLQGLDAWVKKNVDPLVARAAERGPEPGVLDGNDSLAMDNYIGLALATASILPPATFMRSMRMNGTMRAPDYPDAIVLAAAELRKLPITPPKGFEKRPFWIPIGKGRLTGAKVLKRQGDWAQIQATTGPIVVLNPSL
jgi:hypothetical protein